MAVCTMLSAVEFNLHNHSSINYHNGSLNLKSATALHWRTPGDFYDISRTCCSLDVNLRDYFSYERGVLSSAARFRLKKKSQSTSKVRALVDSGKVVQSEEQKHEVRVCVNRSCRRSGAMQTLDIFRSLAPPNVLVESCSCLGHCGAGPNLIVLPAEAFISHCNTASHVARLLEIQCGAYDHENNLKALALKQKGNAAFENGNFSSAESLYTEAIQLKPSGGLHFLYANRSAVKLARGDLANALEDSLKACELAPKWAVAYLRQGEAYTAMGNYEQALSVYSKACSFDTSLRCSKSLREKVQKLESACNVLSVSV